MLFVFNKPSLMKSRRLMSMVVIVCLCLLVSWDPTTTRTHAWIIQTILDLVMLVSQPVMAIKISSLCNALMVLSETKLRISACLLPTQTVPEMSTRLTVSTIQRFLVIKSGLGISNQVLMIPGAYRRLLTPFRTKHLTTVWMSALLMSLFHQLALRTVQTNGSSETWVKYWDKVVSKIQATSVWVLRLMMQEVRPTMVLVWFRAMLATQTNNHRCGLSMRTVRSWTSIQDNV